MILGELSGETLIRGFRFFESRHDGEEDVEGGLEGDDDSGFADDHPEEGGHGEKLQLPESSFVLLDVIEQFGGKELFENFRNVPNVFRCEWLNIHVRFELVACFCGVRF